jgi:hypothetical protein
MGHFSFFRLIRDRHGGNLVQRMDEGHPQHVFY